MLGTEGTEIVLSPLRSLKSSKKGKETAELSHVQRFPHRPGSLVTGENADGLCKGDGGADRTQASRVCRDG